MTGAATTSAFGGCRPDHYRERFQLVAEAKRDALHIKYFLVVVLDDCMLVAGRFKTYPL